MSDHAEKMIVPITTQVKPQSSLQSLNSTQLETLPPTQKILGLRGVAGNQASQSLLGRGQPIQGNVLGENERGVEFARDEERLVQILTVLFYTDDDEAEVIEILGRWAGRRTLAAQDVITKNALGLRSDLLDRLFERLQRTPVWTRSGQTTCYEVMFSRFDRAEDVRALRDQNSFKFVGREEESDKAGAERGEEDLFAESILGWQTNKFEDIGLARSQKDKKIADWVIARLAEIPEGSETPQQLMLMKGVREEGRDFLLRRTHVVTAGDRLRDVKELLRGAVVLMLEYAIFELTLGVAGAVAPKILEGLVVTKRAGTASRAGAEAIGGRLATRAEIDSAYEAFMADTEAAEAVAPLARRASKRPLSPEVQLDWSRRLSSGGHEGSTFFPPGAPEGGIPGTGVFEGRLIESGERVAVKVVPETMPSGKSFVPEFLQEMEGAEAASRIGGPRFYGEVPLGGGRRGFVMEYVEGGFPEVAGWNAQVSERTVTQLKSFRDRLWESGYYYDGELQGFVTPGGGWRPIDFGKNVKARPPKFTPEYELARTRHIDMFKHEINSLEKMAAEALTTETNISGAIFNVRKMEATVTAELENKIATRGLDIGTDSKATGSLGKTGQEGASTTVELEQNIANGGVDLTPDTGLIDEFFEPTMTPSPANPGNYRSRGLKVPKSYKKTPSTTFSQNPRALLSMEEQVQFVQFSPKVNRNAGWRSTQRFTPQPNEIRCFGSRCYEWDANLNIVKASTRDLTLGVRDKVMYEGVPNISAGEDYGHLLGIDFGHIDAQVGRYGGFRQAAAMNRPLGVQQALWYDAERVALDQALQLKRANQPFRVVAEARGYVNAVPAETRIFVESSNGVMFDSGWIQNPVTP